MLTNNPYLLRAARVNYDAYKVPTGLVAAKKLTSPYCNTEKARLDIRTSVNKIGEIVNLSQELNSLLWDMVNGGAKHEDVLGLYLDIALLDVLSNLAIDAAKREFNVDCEKEIKKVKSKYLQKTKSGQKIKPNFLGHVAKTKGYYDGVGNAYLFHKTTMDYVQRCINRKKRKLADHTPRVPFSAIVSKKGRLDRVDHARVREIIADVRATSASIKEIWGTDSMLMSESEKHYLVLACRQELIDRIAQVRLSRATMRYLLLSIESDDNKDIARLLFNALFGTANASFYDLILSSAEIVQTLEECDDGDVELYGLRFKRA